MQGEAANSFSVGVWFNAPKRRKHEAARGYIKTQIAIGFFMGRATKMQMRTGSAWQPRIQSYISIHQANPSNIMGSSWCLEWYRLWWSCDGMFRVDGNIFWIVSEHAFTLVVRGDSMTNPNNPRSIQDGARVVVEPIFDPEQLNRKIVVAMLEGSSEATIKEFIQDGPVKF